MASSFLSSRSPGALPRLVTKRDGKLAAAPAPAKTAAGHAAIGVALSAALISVHHEEPMALLVVNPDSQPDADGRLMLPAGPLLPREHRGLEAGVRALVAAQLGIDLGYTEQLHTFAEQGRVIGISGPVDNDDQPHMVSISYLALLTSAHVADAPVPGAGRWVKCYDILPWEDWRAGRPAVIAELIEPLQEWAARPLRLLGAEPVEDLPNAPSLTRQGRIGLAFGLNGALWDEERTLERHELLYEAGLLSEARRDAGLHDPHNRLRFGQEMNQGPDPDRVPERGLRLGIPLALDHRRMLAMALGRLRAKIKYRPIVFDLMPETFTLFELQCTVQAILGTPLHKQNFRRLVATTGLVEEVGEIRAKTGGRPAQLLRFRPDVVWERSAPGVRIKSMRA